MGRREGRGRNGCSSDVEWKRGVKGRRGGAVRTGWTEEREGGRETQDGHMKDGKIGEDE